MELETIISVVTFVVALILGQVSKKSGLVNRKLIPIQNICIGVVVAVIEFIITKNFSTAILLSGVTAGGTYDILSNLKKLVDDSETLEYIENNPQMLEPEKDTIEEVEYTNDDLSEE